MKYDIGALVTVIPDETDDFFEFSGTIVKHLVDFEILLVQDDKGNTFEVWEDQIKN